MPVTVNVQHCGGGFGRRLEVDFAVEAAEVSNAAGVPVLVTFSRTDDLHHDYPHAPTQHWLRAGWDAANAVSSLRHVVAGPALNGIAYTGGTEVLKIEQAVPYQIAQKKDSAALVDVPLPTGPWRGTFAWPNTFATECFLDEIAAALVEDPVELRRRSWPACRWVPTRSRFHAWCVPWIAASSSTPTWWCNRSKVVWPSVSAR